MNTFFVKDNWLFALIAFILFTVIRFLVPELYILHGLYSLALGSTILEMCFYEKSRNFFGLVGSFMLHYFIFALIFICIALIF